VGEWRDYAGDTYALKYSRLAQITKDSVKSLHVAWTWMSADIDLQKTDPLLCKARPRSSSPIQ
jgi:glucose dehydrogenase